MMKSIRKLMLSSFWGEYAVSIFHEVESRVLPKLISDEKAVKKTYKKSFGRELDLLHPETFSEKLCVSKIVNHDPLLTVCADKYAVREYVDSKGYAYILNECYGVYDKVSDIPFEILPNQFVLKAAHGTHMNFIITNKSAHNFRCEKLMMRSWLRQDIYWRGREWAYKNVPHRIIVEKFLQDESGELRDYKFFCFNGKPKFVQVDIGRFSDRHIRNFYDLDWNFLDITDDVGSDATVYVEKPESFDKMIEIAKDLARPFQHVRVDLYEIQGNPLFGELTFYHNGGISRIQSEEWEHRIGDYWKFA